MQSPLRRVVWPASACTTACAVVLAAQASAALSAPSPHPAETAHSAPASAPAGAKHRVQHSPYLAAQHLGSADVDYAVQWGIDSMQVHQTNGGNLIRFSYRVLDTSKANVLIDKAAAPLMVSPTAHVALQVPVMDKVGPLRQATELESGKTYWMVFSNKGGPVKSGDHVSVVVGSFRVDGLVVQ
jgi:hypothetical protein